MRAAKYLVVVLVCLVAGGCALVSSPSDETSPSPGPTESTESAGAEQSPERDDDEAVDPSSFPTSFDADDLTVLPEKPVYDGIVVGARAVTMTLDRISARTLPDLDTAWQMTPAGFFVDVEQRDEQLYVLDLRVLEGTGTSAGRLSMTLSRVSPSTGAVLGEATWEKRQDVQTSGDPVMKIVAIEDDVVLVESSSSEEDSRVTLTAVDMSTGDELWTRRPGTFVAVEDGVVVASTETSSDSGSLIALDTETGKRFWTGPRDLTAVSGVGVHDGVLTVATESAGATSPTLQRVSMEDGTVEAREPTRFVDWTCHPAEDSVVVCSLPGERAVGHDLATGRDLWQLPTSGRYGVWVSSVRGPYVYGFTSGARSVVLDAATGKDVAESAGAAPVSSNGYGGIIFYGGQAIFYPAAQESATTGE
ncbi:PQQ-binding-like beta-propeller repeat protein [Nocardioides sp. zg-1230]|uniref:outer membrane protein assembly factor BamB family protein n=1 Tax=Nocardioides sp. zg-1230 TaxID=2736601 RepID=UPI001552CAAB|nr:PQQ-binding-like beta-propeller repeat protein [Nocardioides sp. zg-1230]NPC44293.1 PQQ-binding-like beta-propeller repeat protein [Nocardioides sp. zg-1230]